MMSAWLQMENRMQAVSRRGAELLVQALSQAGVDTIFTLSGNHIMPIFDACFDAGMRLIHTRHEAAAVHMADAHARITGRVGIALVTGGPGHANALSALYTASQAESPVVLLSGHAPLSQLDTGAFQEMRQADLAAPLTKAAWTAQSTSELPGDVARAMSLALSGRPGPVHLSLPTDVLEARVAAGRMPDLVAYLARTMPADAASIGAIVTRLRQARRPLILTGPAQMTRHARRACDALEAAMGIPVIGMESPRGIDDPCLGAFGEMLAQADCVLLLGKRLDFTLKFGQAPVIGAQATVLHIDAEAPELDRSRRAFGERLAHSILADAASAIDALTVCARASGAGTSSWHTEVRDAVRYRPAAWDHARSNEPGRLHPVAACRPLQALIDSHPDSVLVADGGEIGQWAQACLSAPHRVINGIAGSIGSSLPFAAAARVAVPDAPVVAVLGDGTFGFHSAEFDTAVRYKLPFVAVVGNDARWNAEYQIQLREYGAARTIGCELLPTRYDQVAAAFGAHGEFVTDPAAMAAALGRAAGSGLPACVNVMIQGLAAPNVKRGAAK
jgi:acetolactate synthase-1/2/3 large subunit